MTNSENQITQEICDYINTEGGPKKGWYVGIAENPKDRLANGHGVGVQKETSDWWIYRDAGSATAARRIEAYFIDVVGTAGGSSGGSSASRYVYAYKMTLQTTQ